MAKGAQQKRRAAARPAPKTRAQRRATERAQAKQAPAKRPFPMSQLIGGLATIIIVGGIIIYAVIQSNNRGKAVPKTAGPPVVTVTAYNPGSMMKVGQTAPNFTLKGADGKSYTLASQRGHPVLLELFAVWCPHCQAEGSTIERLKLQYASQGVRIWSILASPFGPNYDSSYGQNKAPATKADLTYFANTYHEHVPELIDPTFHVVNKYGLTGFPTLYLVDKHGKIVYAESGERPASELSSAITKALNGKT